MGIMLLVLDFLLWWCINQTLGQVHLFNYEYEYIAKTEYKNKNKNKNKNKYKYKCTYN